jgi:hypothetical protein
MGVADYFAVRRWLEHQANYRLGYPEDVSGLVLVDALSRDFKHLRWRQPFLANVGGANRSGANRTVCPRHRRRDLEEGASRLRSDRHRVNFDIYPPCRNSGLECLGQSGALDRDGDLRWWSGAFLTLAVLGGADCRRRDWGLFIAVAPGRLSAYGRSALAALPRIGAALANSHELYRCRDRLHAPW